MTQYYLQQLINGLMLGSLYALVAIGFSMIYGIVRLINFAHGDIVMVGAFVTVGLVIIGGLPWPLIALAVMIAGALVGRTIDRIIDVFPADQQPQIRAMLAESLKGVVSQVLLRKKGGSGRVAAQEIMVCTTAVSNLIREAKIHLIPSSIQTGRKEGMQLLDQHILEFLMAGVIDAEEAYAKSHTKATFATHLEQRGAPAGQTPPVARSA